MKILGIVICVLAVAGCAHYPHPDNAFSLQVFECPSNVSAGADPIAYTSLVTTCSVLLDEKDIVTLDPFRREGGTVYFRCAFTTNGMRKFLDSLDHRDDGVLIFAVNGEPKGYSAHSCKGCKALCEGFPRQELEYVNSQLFRIHRRKAIALVTDCGGGTLRPQRNVEEESTIHHQKEKE